MQRMTQRRLAHRLTQRAGVRYQLTRMTVQERLSAAGGDERGEIGSWLIVAAGLAIAAAAAVGPLGDWIGERVLEITNNTGAGAGG